MSETPPRQPDEPSDEDEAMLGPSPPDRGGPDEPANGGPGPPAERGPTDAGWLLAALAAIVVALVLLLAATWAGVLPLGAPGPGVAETPTASGTATPTTEPTSVAGREPVVIQLAVNVTEPRNASQPAVIVLNVSSPNQTGQDVVVVDVDTVAAAEAGAEVRVVSEQENVQLVRAQDRDGRDRDGDSDRGRDRDDRARNRDDGDRERDDRENSEGDGDRDEDRNRSKLGVAEVHFDAEGNDHENRNDEYIVFKNTGETPLDMGGWAVSDTVERRRPYTVPSGFTLDPGTTVTLYTGRGENTDSELYWGYGQAIWNNDGDTVQVKDGPDIVLEYSYGGGQDQDNDRDGDEGQERNDRDQADRRAITECTRIDEPGGYVLTRDLRNADADTCLRITADDVDLDGNGHTLDGIDRAASVGVGVLPTSRDDTVRNVSVTDLELRDWGTGFRVSEWTDGGRVTDLLVRDVASASNVLDGVYAAHAGNARIDGVTTRDNGRHGVFLQEVDDRNRLTNSEVVGNDGTGVVAFEGGTGLVIRGNAIRDNGAHGIDTSNDDRDVRIEDNLVEGNGQTGLDLDESTGITVVGNAIRSNDRQGISAQDLGPNAVVRRNEIRRNGADGIALESLRRATVGRNTVRDNRGYGVSLENVRETGVRDNDLCDNDQGPYRDVDGTDNRFVDNDCAEDADGDPPAPTGTPPPEPSGTPTDSPIPRDTPTPTPTPTETAVPTDTPTPAETETPPDPSTPTPTPTTTATATASPTPTATPPASSLRPYRLRVRAAMADPTAGWAPLVGAASWLLDRTGLRD